jgi:hypothetical protein
MPLYEVDSILRNYNENYREGWEKVRFLRNTIGACLGAELNDLKFSWDAEEIRDSKDIVTEQYELMNLVNNKDITWQNFHS